MIQTLIIDDEPLALEILENHLSKIEELHLVGKCTNAVEASKYLRDNEVDLIFIDIQMPQLTGVEFVKSLSNPPMVVFTTAYPEYAVEGFNLEALDYLLKPISFDRFLKACNKAIDKFNKERISTLQFDGPIEEDFFFVKSDKKMMKVFYKDILYIEGLKDYVIIRTETGRVITLQTMKSLEVRLPQSMFKRIHRSYILNLKKLIAIEGNMVELIEKGQVKLLPVGKSYRDELTELVESKKL